MDPIIPALLSVGCLVYFIELVSGPWKWLDRLMGIDDHPSPEEIDKIQLGILLEQNDISIRNGRVLCNECLRVSCGFCNNGKVIQEAQHLLDHINEA
jgi:hypothetical protein